MDYKQYKATYQQLLTNQGRELLEKDSTYRADMEKKINEFLEKYPSLIPLDKQPNTPIHLLSVKEIFHRTMLVGIDIINDIADVVSKMDVNGPVVTRRLIFTAFTKPERRVYIGVWLIFLAFVFFFIDGSS